MTGNAVGGARVKALNRRSQNAAIEQFRAYITVTSLAAACALWWQNGNKWSETGKIHEIRDKMYCCAFGCQNRNANHFYRMLSSKTPFEAKRRHLNRQTNE